MKSKVNTGPGTASIDRISNPSAPRHSAMTRTSILLRRYAVIKSYWLPLSEPNIRFFDMRRRIADRLRAAGLANQISREIRASRENFYSDLADRHCSEARKALVELRRLARILCSEQQMDADLLTAQMHREFAYLTDGEEREEHLRTVEKTVARTQLKIATDTDPIITIRVHWEHIFLHAIRNNSEEMQRQIPIALDWCYAIMRSLERSRPEKANQIRTICTENAYRLKIDIGIRWRSPKKPVDHR